MVPTQTYTKTCKLWPPAQCGQLLMVPTQTATHQHTCSLWPLSIVDTSHLSKIYFLVPPFFSFFFTKSSQSYFCCSVLVQVTFDVAWSADCIDGRCYDYKGIAKSCDFLFVMSYDEQSQIFGSCIAMANSPYNKTAQGMLDRNSNKFEVPYFVWWDMHGWKNLLKLVKDIKTLFCFLFSLKGQYCHN